MPSFAEIQSEIANIMDSVDDMSPEQLDACADYIDMLATQEADKVDGFAFFVREQLARTEFFKEEIKRMSAKAKTIENTVNYLKGLYLSTMQSNGLSKVAGKAYTLSVRASKAVQVDVSPACLPDSLVRVKTTIEADKSAIKAMIDEGKDVEGCRLVENYSLQIK